MTLTSDTGASNADFITSNGGVHFAGTVADTGGAGIASVQVFNGATLLGTATVVAGNWSLDTTLAAGTYSDLKVTATDVAGNASTTNSVQTIIVDSTPPAAGTLSFTNLTDTGSSDTPPVTTDNSFNLALTGPESGASIAYQVSLNGGAFTNTTASQSGLADGNYQFRALVTDAAGNSSTSNVITVVIDSTPPAAVAISDGAERRHWHGRRLHHQCGGTDGERHVHGCAGSGREDPGERQWRDHLGGCDGRPWVVVVGERGDAVGGHRHAVGAKY